MTMAEAANGRSKRHQTPLPKEEDWFLGRLDLPEMDIA